MKIRVNKPQNDFTMVPNHVLNDQRLSSGAVGVLCWLMMNVDGFTVTVKDIETRFSIKRRAWTRIREELKSSGALEQHFTPRVGTSLSVGWPAPQPDTTSGVLGAHSVQAVNGHQQVDKKDTLTRTKPPSVKREIEKASSDFMSEEMFTRYKLEAKPNETRSQWRARVGLD